MSGLRRRFVEAVYGDHNRSPAVRRAVRRVLEEMPANGSGLNVGAGDTRLDCRFRNLEIEPGEGIDIVGSIESMPLESSSLDLVFTQEVLEHVADPFGAAREIARVLRPGGVAYIQLPFVIGHHPCPHDFWRFTHEGIVALVTAAGLEVTECAPSVGPASGFYRIAVEFVAVLASTLRAGLYIPAKSAAALSLYPVKWLDPLLLRSEQAARICGGYYVVCRKPMLEGSVGAPDAGA